MILRKGGNHMKVLWINNIAIPKIAIDMGQKTVPVGGWMVKLADELVAIPDMKLYIMFPSHSEVSGSVDNIQYTGFMPTDEKCVERVLAQFEPDVVHIHGTEGVHSNVVARVCERMGIINRVIVSIQGLMSIYAKHYRAFLPNNVVYGMTARDVLKGNVYKGQNAFAKAGKLEIDTLSRVKHVIGRTDWDRAVTKQINPQVNYHFNNEMLRNSFYPNRWEINNCERYSIFCSQATAPLKGLHMVIEAMAIIKERYPEVQLFIAGKSYTQKPKYQLSRYEKYVLSLISKYKLQDRVHFTGFLNEEEICSRYLKSHVFVSASSIENSPNSVCEAMILGMPVVSSMVGGVANLMTHGVDGFYYQADAPYMLAYYVEKIFENDKRAVVIGTNARNCALERHDPETIVDELLQIYNAIN